MSNNFRLGIDMGSTSIGWCLLELDENNIPRGIKKMGVRLFPDGRDDKKKEPLSVVRREKRGARRNRDRALERLNNLISKFSEIDFLPSDEEERKRLFRLDPYQLRSRALDEKLSKYEIARAIIHLSKRRGFLSNRKTDKDDETGLFKEAIKNLSEKLQQSDARTLGEYLHKQNTIAAGRDHLKKSLRFRYGKGYDEDERIFPRRDMLMDEFNKIWDSQARYHQEMNEQLKEDISHIIFFQRPLKKPQPGRCILEEDEPRAPVAYPIFQQFRYYQIINDLKIIEGDAARDLTGDERGALIELLKAKKDYKLAALRKKLYGKDAGNYRFNFEYDNRDKIPGDEVNAAFVSSKDKSLRDFWLKLADDYDKQKELITILLSDEDDDIAAEKIAELGAEPELSENLLYAKLPDGYANLSLKALEKIVPFLKEGHNYYTACKKAGYDHSGNYDGSVYDEGNLPYYGELLTTASLPVARKTYDKNADDYGKINNPTVHIALNQLRKIVNALTKKYGAPQQIVLELARDLKLSREHKKELNKQLKKRTDDNIRIEKNLKEIGVANNRENRMRFRLWEELSTSDIERCCIYSGKQIPVNELFTEKFEIEHILPKSKTFDDSFNNKTISYYAANRYKGERSPYEAFAESRDGYDWDAIVSRSKKLPKNKAKRFLKNAMEKFNDENQVIARMLNDTRYMSRAARQYLSHVCGADNVYVITGQQTAMLRGKWGLNKALNTEEYIKKRDDHRHHAVDAFVIAMTSRSFIHRYTTTIKNSRDRFIENLGPPWEGFSHDEFAKKVNSINVSVKPNHINTAKLRKRNQTAGSLLEDTAYSYLGPDPDNSKYALYAVRKNIEDLTVKNIENIKSPEIKRRVQQLNGDNTEKSELKTKIRDWAEGNNIRKLKMIVKANPKTMIPVHDKNGKPFKYLASGENLYAEIFIPDPTDPDSRWGIELVNSYNAHQPGFKPNWKQETPIAKKVMRLYKNDIVAIDDGSGGRELRRVRKMSNGIIYLRKLNISARPSKQDDIGEQFSVRQLQAKRARKAGIDIIGRTFDPLASEPDEHHRD